MVDFKTRNGRYYYRAYEEKTKQNYKIYTSDICERLAKTAEDKFFFGCKLLEYYNSQAYSCRASDDDVKEYGWFADRNACSQCFFAVCELDFGLDKSQVSRLINVVDEFGDGCRGLKKQWKDYKWTILCELLPLTPEQRQPVRSDWSLKRVREYKKNLVAAPQQENNDEIDSDALDETVEGEGDGDQYDKYKPAELRKLLKQRDAEIDRLKTEVSSLRNGDAFKKMEEDLAYYKSLAIRNMHSGAHEDTSDDVA